MGIYVEYRQRNGDHDGGGIIWLWLWLWLIANGFCKSDISDRTKEKANESSKSPGGGRGEYMINTQQAKVDAKKMVKFRMMDGRDGVVNVRCGRRG